MLDTTTGRDTQLTHAIIGRSPGGSILARLDTATLRALRTLLQGIAAAFPAAGAGTVVLQTTRVIQGSGMLCGVYLSQRRAAIKGWPARERIELPHLIQRTGHHVYHITGFDREEIIDLCIRINSVERGTGTPVWPPCLGLFKSVAATLTYMRHNRTQAEIGESLGVSQPTISRAVAAITPLIPERGSGVFRECPHLS
jgi:hypothetical protein